MKMKMKNLVKHSHMYSRFVNLPTSCTCVNVANTVIYYFTCFLVFASVCVWVGGCTREREKERQTDREHERLHNFTE